MDMDVNVLDQALAIEYSTRGHLTNEISVFRRQLDSNKVVHRDGEHRIALGIDRQTQKHEME